MTILLAPTENKLLNLLGDKVIVSSIPEERGADILIFSKNGVYGAQRKEFPYDFIASFNDGRMARETTLLAKNTDFHEVICEGRAEYLNGILMTSSKVPRRYTKHQIEGMRLDIRLVKHVDIAYTEDIYDTSAYIKIVETFMAKEVHTGLFRRPAAQGLWGSPTSDEVALWILQGFPEVGPGLAEAILKHFGTIPMKWTCEFEDLLKVHKIGPSRARKLWNALQSRIEDKR